MWHPKKNFGPIFACFQPFFMSFFHILGSIFEKCAMTNDRFAERHSFNVLGFIQLLYDTTWLFTDFWVNHVWGLGCRVYFPCLVSHFNYCLVVGFIERERRPRWSGEWLGGQHLAQFMTRGILSKQFSFNSNNNRYLLSTLGGSLPDQSHRFGSRSPAV